MNIAQGLIRKGRLVDQLRTLQGRLQMHNSVQLVRQDADPQRDFDPEEVLAELDKTREELIDLKFNLEQASLPQRRNIFKLSELKTELGMWKNLSTQKGEFKPPRRYGSEESTENEHWDATFDVHFQQKKIENIEKAIDDIQNEINEFNLTTQVG